MPVLLSAVLCGCSVAESRSSTFSLTPLTEVNARLAFTCVHEIIPEPSAESDVLFQYARWMQKNNQLKEDPAVNVEIERLYRIAAENGHYKANINLQNGTRRGEFKLRGDEHLRLSQNLIDAGVATGYYFIGVFLKNGSAGLKQDPEMSLRFFRKAADTGSAQAQYEVGEKLEPSNIAPRTAFQMYRCAAEQGQGDAAVSLGIHLKNKKQYREALETFQLGAAAGHETAAGWLEDVFRGPEPTNVLYYLAQPKDLERANRYEKIWRILANYSYANPKVPEINEIVPLPPAPLPAWDGKLQWLEARRANVPPEKPSEALIRELAKAKVLDPTTGKPMPGSPAFSENNFIGPGCSSGAACPQSGYWRIRPYTEGRYWLTNGSHPRYFKQGEIMPQAMVSFFRKSIWPLPEKYVEYERAVNWVLIG